MFLVRPGDDDYLLHRPHWASNKATSTSCLCSNREEMLSHVQNIFARLNMLGAKPCHEFLKKLFPNKWVRTLLRMIHYFAADRG